MLQVDGSYRSGLSLIKPEEVPIYTDFLDKATGTQNSDRRNLLLSIPYPSLDSYGPVLTLSALVSSLEGPWPVLQLQQTFARAWRTLPDQARAGQASQQAQSLLDLALRQWKQSYTSLLDIIDSRSAAPALIDPEDEVSLTHESLASIVQDFGLLLAPVVGQAKPVIAIAIPNGALLALTVLATATYWSAAPMACGSDVSAEQLKSDVLKARTSILVATAADVSRLGLRGQWLADAGIKVLLLECGRDLKLAVHELHGGKLVRHGGSPRPKANSANDTGLILFTSGTSGTKKSVPLSIHSMVCGAAMVVESWGLDQSMRCLNQMPLNHVGGLIRSLLAPILSGGSVVCCRGFDANSFWDYVEDFRPTWYYASPTMHQLILDVANDRAGAVNRSHIRLVCNAAGGLLPSLACELQETFSKSSHGCTVLPSYGMTECMPISTPSLDYRLEKSGTSGTTAGPEIAILDSQDNVVQSHTLGRVCVRGLPLFGGYLRDDGSMDRSCFTPLGWFDTGDMGYQDEDGYLFITGRNKEVINRGGEIISPYEVEEAIIAAAAVPSSPIYGKVSRALAFSVDHNVLQEVVGVAVSTPRGSKRSCLRTIQEALNPLISKTKIPTLIVFMDDGLPVNNNKVLRIRLAQRLGLPQVSDHTPFAERQYEASCAPNVPTSKSIPCRLLEVDTADLNRECREIFPADFEFCFRSIGSEIGPQLLIAPIDKQQQINAAEFLTLQELHKRLFKVVHSYLLPHDIRYLTNPFPQDGEGKLNNQAVDELLAEQAKSREVLDFSSTELIVAKLFSETLPAPLHTLSRSTDFFVSGGDSLKAGRLVSALRRRFGVKLGIDVLFKHHEISALASYIDRELATVASRGSSEKQEQIAEREFLPGCNKSYSSTRPLILLLQLVPMCILYPMKRALTWTIFMYFLKYSQGLLTASMTPGRMVNLVLSLVISRLVTQVVAPVCALILKWLIIGRHEEGLYPMWGMYHTRWWFCQKTLMISGLGVFNWFNWSRVFFYRCLGAKIGKKVSIDKGATLGEYDLISVDDGVTLERCSIRPFAVERNASMYLGRISIGANSSVGLQSTVAAGTSLPRNTCLGPNSSSWEAAHADEANRDLASNQIPRPHWALMIFVGLPIQAISAFMEAVPWLACLTGLVQVEPKRHVPDMLREAFLWFSSSQRVGWHFAALAANAAFGPIFLFIFVVVLKKSCDAIWGKIQPSEAKRRSQSLRFRMHLFRSILPAPRFHKLTELFGTHYEATSVFARALGAQVGKRVYWPGTGPSWQDIDLINIGNDVVFGSRSHLVTSDGTGSDYIHVRDHAMVADRVVLLPGTQVNENVVLGSGALTRRNCSYPAGSTWVGSRENDALCLDTGTAKDTKKALRSSLTRAGYENSSTCDDVEKKPLTTIFKLKANESTANSFETDETAEESSVAHSDAASFSPFGRAFYAKLAPYRVWSQSEITLYSTLIVVASAVFWNTASIGAVQVVGRLFRSYDPITRSLLGQRWYRPIGLYVLFLTLIVGIMALQSLTVLAFLVGTKWVILGRRKPGNYDWDKSSYCQRWQLFLKLEHLRRHCYGGHGILGMLTGTHWMVLYFRAMGASIGKDCALFAGGRPTLLFTEPELLSLGDRVAVDDASLVGHINTRGKFDLNRLQVGDRSVLRSGSRLLSGAKMEADSCLLEHTLIMAGDVVDAGSTSQGWPAEEFKGSRVPTLKVK